MLDELTREQLDEWRVYVEGVGTEQWWQVATVASAIDRLAAAIIASHGGKPGKPPRVEDYLPIVRSNTRPSVDSQLASLEKALEKMTWQ
ncbi:MAG: hypothetical protein AAGF31_07425 [Planctomycetota bacterium]